MQKYVEMGETLDQDARKAARRKAYRADRRKDGLILAAAFLLSIPIGIAFDDAERGLIAFAQMGVLGLGVRWGWAYRHYRWFWGVLAAMVIVSMFELVAITWPKLGMHGDRATFYLVGVGNGLAYLVVFATVRRLMIGKALERVLHCISCHEEIPKEATRCPHCGDWQPGPVPAWALAVGLTPVAIVWVALLCFADWNGPARAPGPRERSFAVGEELASPFYRSTALDLVRARHFSCAKVRSVRYRGMADGRKRWDVRCDEVLRYAVYPSTGFVKSCASEDEACK